MKLLDKAVEKAVEGSKRFRDAIDMVGALATEVARMGHAMIGIARTVHAHQLAIQELYALNGALLKSMREHSLDMKMPGAKKSDDESKPN